MSALKLWQESINQYYTSKGTSYKVPKKGTDDYTAIKRIYDKKRGGKTEEKKPETKTKKKNCECNYACSCEKKIKK